MNKDKFMDRLQDIFRDVFDDESMQIDRATNADMVETWDSLVHINLIVAIEKEFQIKFALGELQDLKDVGDLVDAVIKKTA
jgi:acyl carrier protein